MEATLAPAVERRQTSAVVRHERRRLRALTPRWVGFFLALTAAFTGLALWLLSRHYLNDAALWSWSVVIGSLEAPQGGFNRFVLLYPQVQYYFLTVLSWVPGLKTPQLPYLLSAATAAALLTHFAMRMRQVGLPRPLAVLVVAAVALNPLFLWAATSGGGESMGMALYYLLGLSLIVLRYSHSLHAHMILGFTLLLFFITDARSLYLAITLLPLMPLIVQRHILRLNPVAPLLVLYSPLLFMIGIWLALNWLYTGDSLAFLKDPASPFLGARISADYLPWRAGFGGQFWSATALSAALLVVCYPVLLLVLLTPVRRSRVFGAAVGIALMPVFASGLATWAEFTQSPADILVFVFGGVMALLTTGRVIRERPRLVVLLLCAGSLGSVTLFQKYPAVGMEGWFDAIGGQVTQQPKEGDLQVGLWARKVDGLMIDENTGYAVIGGRGRATGLYLTFSDRFKQSVNSGRPLADWIAVPSPQRDAGRRDQVAHNFPHLYEEGLPGYFLAYDRAGWRVYVNEDRLRTWMRQREDDHGRT